MTAKVKVWLLASIALILMGCVLFFCVMMSIRWDFRKLSTTKYETNTYAITEPFSDVHIITDTADTVFKPSVDGTVSVECYEQVNAHHTVSVKDGILCIEVTNTQKWYEHIGMNFGSPKITVYLPTKSYGALTLTGRTGDVEIPQDFTFRCIDALRTTGDIANSASAAEGVRLQTSTGAICVDGVTTTALHMSASTGQITMASITCAGDISVDVSTGRVKMTDVTCKNLHTHGDTGDLLLDNVIASETISINRDTGTVMFDGCDAVSLSVITNTGDVKGSLLTGKMFVAHTDTGRVRVPSTTGGRCEITTDTGDIIITVE